MKISKIFLYNELTVPEIQIENLAVFLKNTFPIQIEIRTDISKYVRPNTLKKIASCRIFNPRKPFERHSPTMEEIHFEEQSVMNAANKENIIMYDGFEIQQVLSELIPESEANEDLFHIFFTNKLTCTYDYNDYRYHGRALIGANPSIISTTGIIEAPAKPREYYLDLMNKYSQGLNLESIKEKYKGEYLEYNDPRLSKIIEGYLLQALFYYETAEAFCDDTECRLFNAHWQKELLHSQLESRKLCKNHQEILQKLTMT